MNAPYKQFKDPIYGYIKIDQEIAAKIIDTPIFQRLKNIRQTSYTPLYPGAYHNRFVHSLGVYHLGKMAFKSIHPQLESEGSDTKIKDCVEQIRQIFELSCLLHDVGHAPFSHTGESFFEDTARTMDRMLIDEVGDAFFQADFLALGTNLPAPHERMSCIVGLRGFPTYFETPETRGLFARCILGLPYQFKEQPPVQTASRITEEGKKALKDYHAKKKCIELLNCVISLLNSSIIDVDRLDYIIRDAATIGFDNVQVDYKRLLSGTRIVCYHDKYCIGYHKSALSTIESAIYAHDAEKKWVQNHPAIIYEMEALKSAIRALNEMFKSAEDPNPLFCYESLSEGGKTLVRYESLFSEEIAALSSLWSPEAVKLLENNRLFAQDVHDVNGTLEIAKKYPVSLLADEDVLYFIKHLLKDQFAYEYFARNNRRSAAWKSEAEFRTLFQVQIGEESKAINTLEKALEDLSSYARKALGVSIVNDKLASYLESERQNAEHEKQENPDFADIYDDILQGVNEKIYWVNLFRTIKKELVEQGIPLQFEFLIVPQKAFSSSFKESIEDIPIVFPNLQNDPYPLGQIVTVLGASKKRKSNFFHLFYAVDTPIDSNQKKRIVHTISSKLIIGVLSKENI